MNPSVTEPDGSNNSIGRRFSRTVSSGSAVRVAVGSPPINAERDRRLRTVTDPADEGRDSLSGSESYDDARSSIKKKHSQDRVRTQYSLDSGSGGRSGSIDLESEAPNGATASVAKPKALKSIWKRTVDKLIKKKSKSDEPTDRPADRKTSLPVNESAMTEGEIDPVYSFLKLTAVMPRQGTTNVIPEQGHRCCPGSKVDNNSGYGLVEEYTHSDDPSKCQCPCHLPERLEACHSAWKKAFSIKNS